MGELSQSDGEEPEDDPELTSRCISALGSQLQLFTAAFHDLLDQDKVEETMSLLVSSSTKLNH